MNGNKIFLDTNIIVYFLEGDDTLTIFLDGKTPYISFITKLELLGYESITHEQEVRIEAFLSNCIIIGINTDIEREVIRIRKKYRVKLPDSIIMATAIYHDLPLITADRDFENIIELNVIHYVKE
jgi:predicted nucleic acid-binding protein